MASDRGTQTDFLVVSEQDRPTRPRMDVCRRRGFVPNLIFWHLNKVQFGRVQTGSAKYRHPLNFKPDHRSSSTTDLNFQTGPGFGSARFRFELWFRTEPWHHYSSDPSSPSVLLSSFVGDSDRGVRIGSLIRPLATANSANIFVTVLESSAGGGRSKVGAIFECI